MGKTDSIFLFTNDANSEGFIFVVFRENQKESYHKSKGLSKVLIESFFIMKEIQSRFSKYKGIGI